MHLSYTNNLKTLATYINPVCIEHQHLHHDYSHVHQRDYVHSPPVLLQFHYKQVHQAKSAQFLY